MSALFEIIVNSLVDGKLPRDFSLPSIDDGKIKWADGAMDGVTLYHMGTSAADENELVLMEQAVRATAEGNLEKSIELFTELGKLKSALSLIDNLQQFIIEHQNELTARNVLVTSAKIVRQSEDRECVKYGLAMLELFNIGKIEELISMVTTIGLSDEFTLFALFILLKLEDGNERIFELAKKVHGWGRIHAIERLEPSTDEIKNWILMEGVHNDILPAYSALTCWNKANVAQIIKGDLSEDMVKGIKDIINGLLDEGPVAGCSTIKDWEECLKIFEEKEKMYY